MVLYQLVHKSSIWKFSKVWLVNVTERSCLSILLNPFFLSFSFEATLPFFLGGGRVEQIKYNVESFFLVATNFRIYINIYIFSFLNRTKAILPLFKFLVSLLKIMQQIVFVLFKCSVGLVSFSICRAARIILKWSKTPSATQQSNS